MVNNVSQWYCRQWKIECFFKTLQLIVINFTAYNDSFDLYLIRSTSVSASLTNGSGTVSPLLPHGDSSPRSDNSQRSGSTLSSLTTEGSVDESGHVPDIHNPDRSGRKRTLLDAEKTLSKEQKKAKIEEVYNSAQWVTPQKHMDDRVRKVVREHIFVKTKFCKGEGVAIVKSKEGKRLREAKKVEYGKTHDRFDLTGSGYALEVMKRCDVTEDRYSLQERALWWKVYGSPVKDEIMSVRGRKGYNSRDLIQNSEITTTIFT